ncbi:polyprenyl synthetase family protein [Pistricoccus aurantiacus]|uniref:polyprenyl synthetase family protein n=1 Tax=Pistricoccus aurantiacus TaxID=1883414 RepID=UPI00364195A8
MASSIAPPAVESSEQKSLIELRCRVDRRLETLLAESASDDDPVSRAMRESLLAPGRRVRPILLILAGRELGGDLPALLDLGCAVEMIHTASLILDDLPCMDDASLRRGRPTMHRLYGEDVAMLAVVALLSRASGVVAESTGLFAQQRTQMVERLSRAVGIQGLVKGQYEDLHEACHVRSIEAVMATNTRKTGVLFQAAMYMAALAAGADETVIEHLDRFALALGQAYQLCDDLSDGCAAQGKDVHQDRDKTTLVSLLGPEEVRRRLAGQLEEADRHLSAVYGADSSLSRFMRGLFPLFR